MSAKGLVVAISWMLVTLTGMKAYCQEETQLDSIKVSISFNKSDTAAVGRDTIPKQIDDVSPLDIGGSRGVFILSADKMLQLRILGSIRTSINFTDQDMPDHQTFNPYEIPTNVDTKSPNFFAGLQQTRIGIEVIRRTDTQGDLFIRFEGDFKNSTTSLRIRHAYGQIGRYLIGQTWSLFNNVSYQPALVSLDGPASGSGLRTPQVRYSRETNPNTSWNVAIEHSAPEIEVPDTVDIKVLPVIPNFTGRFSHRTNLISYRISGIITTLSGKDQTQSISYNFGYGVSLAGKMKIKSNGEIFFHFAAGKAISHLMDTFNGKNQDVVYNPNTAKFEPLLSTGGYLAYEHQLPKGFTTSLTAGITSINYRDFQPDDAYHISFNTLLNLFWQPTTGARLGMELASGRRYDKGGARGVANRLSFLMYYDF